MKKTGIYLLALLCCTAAKAQNIELKAQLYSGFFGFSGHAATKTSPMVHNPYALPSISTSRPYGTKPGGSVGVGAQFSLVTQAKVVMSISAAYESLGSNTDIDSLYDIGVIYNRYAASGKTKHRANFLSFRPELGYRFKLPGFKIDLHAGINIAHTLKTTETGTATYNGTNYHSSNSTTHPATDTRPVIGISLLHKKAGFDISYEWGLKNYYGIYIGGTQPEAFSRFLKLGLSYRIK